MKGYYDSVENVIFLFSPITRFLIKIGMPRDWFVVKCPDCKRIPMEYGYDTHRCTPCYIEKLKNK
jgi:hypothetical protein